MLPKMRFSCLVVFPGAGVGPDKSSCFDLVPLPDESFDFSDLDVVSDFRFFSAFPAVSGSSVFFIISNIESLMF